MKGLIVLILACLIALAGCGGGSGASTGSDTGLTTVIYFDSVDPNNFGELINRTYDPTPVPIYGTLMMPKNPAAPVPAMVIAHGSGGIKPSPELAWASYFNSLGIAAFVVDSFTPRGIVPDGTGVQVSSLLSVADALKALEVLAARPDIDPNRIGIIGGSRGGNVSYVTAFEEVRLGIISGSLKFAAHIPLYPNCNVRRWSPNLTGAPLLFLLGASDDYTPAANCSTFVNQSYLPLGADVTTKIYANAYHGFDGKPPVKFSSKVVTFRDCFGEQRLDTLEFVRYDTGQVFANGTEYNNYLDSCSQTGAHVGGNKAARAQARIDVRSFLTSVFHL